MAKSDHSPNRTSKIGNNKAIPPYIPQLALLTPTRTALPG